MCLDIEDTALGAYEDLRERWLETRYIIEQCKSSGDGYVVLMEGRVNGR